MNNQDFISELSKLRSGSTFLTIKGYRNSFQEIADYSLVFNMSYRNALKRSIKTLEAMSLGNDLERQARSELIESWNKSLLNLSNKNDPTFSYFKDEEGRQLAGIKLHNTTNVLHLSGLQVHKRVRLAGVYPEVKHRTLTLAKMKLSSLTSVGKYKMFSLTPHQVESINVQGLELLPPE
jgi:hypothetical protein